MPRRSQLRLPSGAEPHPEPAHSRTAPFEAAHVHRPQAGSFHPETEKVESWLPRAESATGEARLPRKTSRPSPGNRGHIWTGRVLNRSPLATVLVGRHTS